MINFLGLQIGVETQASVIGPNPAPDDDYWYSAPGWAPGQHSLHGLDEDTALQLSAVYLAVYKISTSVAQLPLHVYQRTGPNTRERVSSTDNELAHLLSEAPNDVQDKFGFIEYMTRAVLLRGNAYAHIDRSARNKIRRLTPLDPGLMRPEVTTTGMVYHYREGIEQKQYAQRDIFHLRGPSLDGGYTGVSPITAARLTLATNLTLENLAQRFYTNGSHLNLSLEVAGRLKPDMLDNLKRSIREGYSGVGNAYKIAVLEEGMKLNPLSMNAQDAEFMLARQWGVVEIARWFDMPPHMLKDLTHATYSNIEQQSLDYVVYTLQPHLTRWEFALKRQILGDDATMFCKFEAGALLRGDSAARASFYQQGVNGGWLSVNEVRELEDRNPVEGGDQHLRPLNLAPLNEAPPAEAPPRPGRGGLGGAEAADARFLLVLEQARDIFFPFFAQNLNRAMRKEQKAYAEALRKGRVAGFVVRFYPNFDALLIEIMEPLCERYAEQARLMAENIADLPLEWSHNQAEIGAKCAKKWARGYARRAKQRLKQPESAGQLPDSTHEEAGLLLETLNEAIGRAVET